MTPPSLISTTASTNYAVANSNKNTASVTWLTGDLIAVWGFTGDNSNTLTAPTATGLTFANVLTSNVASRIKLYLWTATAAAGGSSAVSSTLSGALEGGIVAKVWRGASGFGTVSTLGSGTSGAPSVAYTVSALDSAVDGGWGDWNAVAGARTYRTTNLGTATEDHYYSSGSFATTASWDTAASTATGSQTIGLTAPTATAWLLAGIEVLGSGAAASVPPILLMAPPAAGGI